MNDATLAKIYGAVGTALFGFSVNLFWWERTGGTILKTIVPHKEVAASILIGQFAITILGFFVLYVAKRYSDRKSTAARFLRMPPAFTELGSSQDPLAVFVRILGLVCFLIVPGYISGHFLLFLWSIPVSDRREEIVGLNFHTPTLDFLKSGTFFGDNRFRFQHHDGVAFFPGLEGILVTFLTVAFILSILLYLGSFIPNQRLPVPRTRRRRRS